MLVQVYYKKTEFRQERREYKKNYGVKRKVFFFKKKESKNWGKEDLAPTQILHSVVYQEELKPNYSTRKKGRTIRIWEVWTSNQIIQFREKRKRWKISAAGLSDESLRRRLNGGEWNWLKVMEMEGRRVRRFGRGRIRSQTRSVLPLRHTVTSTAYLSNTISCWSV